MKGTPFFIAWSTLRAAELVKPHLMDSISLQYISEEA